MRQVPQEASCAEQQKIYHLTVGQALRDQERVVSTKPPIVVKTSATAAVLNQV
jgi:hypothetical protein